MGKRKQQSIAKQLYHDNTAAAAVSHPGLREWMEDPKNSSGLVEPRGPEQPNTIIRIGTTPIEVQAHHETLLKSNTGLKEDCTVMIGIGEGDTLIRFLRKMEKGHQITVVEPFPELIALAFKRHDFSKWLRTRALYIVTCMQDMAMLVNTLDTARVVGQWNVSMYGYAHRSPTHLKYFEALTALLNQLLCNTGTVMSSGAKIAHNDIITLPYCIEPRGVNALTDIFKGKPAVVVSTGPSLERNIHLLMEKEYRERVVIVAVGQALRVLLAYDIRPDFICSVDFGEVNMAHYEGLLDSDVPMVILNRAYAPLLQDYQGPKFISSEGAVHGLLAGKGCTEQGGSVAHMAFSLARLMGCDPIILVGQDLALGSKSHTSQADAMGSVTVKDGNIEWDVKDPNVPLLNKNKCSMGPATEVPGYFGELVLTNLGLAAFITAFENFISSCNVSGGPTVINATEGGAFLRGAQHRFLKPTLEKIWSDTPHIPGRLRIVQELCTPDPEAKAIAEKVVVALQKDIDNLNKGIEHCTKGLSTLEEMQDAQGDKLLQVMKQNKKHSEAAHECAKENPLWGTAIYSASRRIHGRDLNVKGTKKHLMNDKRRQDLMTRIERNRIILTAAKEGGEELLPLYKEALVRVREYMKHGSIYRPPVLNGLTTKQIEEYFEIGNWARPLVETNRLLNILGFDTNDSPFEKKIIERAIKMRTEAIEQAKAIQDADFLANRHLLPQYNELVEKAQRLGRDEQHFAEAMKVLEEAVELLPTKVEARWGLASCYVHVRRFEDARKQYDALLQDAKPPRAWTYMFEKGVSYLTEGTIAEGLPIVRSVMAETDEFDWFYRIVGKLLMETGDAAGAINAWERYLKRYPNDHTYRRILEEAKRVVKPT